MRDNRQYIATLCQKLQDEGLRPSVGLIKARADRPLAIPEVIQTLKRWMSAPDQTLHAESSDVSDTPVELSLEARVTYLEKQINFLTQQLASIIDNRS